MDWPTISVVVLNYNGKHHLQACLTSLLALDYPAEQHEILVVDNASADGSADFVREQFPTVRLIQNQENIGFAAGNNRGAQEARGRYVVFLNNDTRVDSQFLRELVKPCLAQPDVVCTAAKILDWDGQRVDFVSSAMNFHAFAFQRNIGDQDTYHEQRPLLFACGGAMLIQRDIFLDSGGFDEDYFIYFEDLDLGWRLWLMGFRVMFVPTAMVYHRLHATMNAFSDFRKWVLFERNALITLLKNYGEESLDKTLPTALLLMFKRAARFMRAGGWNPQSYYIRDRRATTYTDSVNRSGLAVIVAAEEVVDNLSKVYEKRAKAQALRRRSDADIFAMLGQPLRSHTILYPDLDEDYARAHYAITRLMGVTGLFATFPRRVLIISSDLLPLPGFPTTGAGLRAWSIGQGLRARGHEVLFSMPKAAMVGRSASGEGCIADLLWEQGQLDEVVARAGPDVVVACGWSTLAHLQHATVPVVLDQHGPHLLERGFQKHLDESTNTAEKLRGLSKADFFTCAGERQRRYFLPWLQRAGFEDPEGDSAVMPVSLGGQWPAVERRDGETTFVYGGVFLPWQDPSLALTTLVERMEALGRGRLRIFGGEHPFIPIDTQSFQQLKERLAKSRRVEVSPMLPREALLAEYQKAHVAIDLMKRNPERELAFTTRTVEYLWCGLPVIYNNYAELADYIGPANAGWCLDPEDRSAMVTVFDEILLHPNILTERSRRARQIAEERLNWSESIEPLDQFIRMPYKRRVPVQTQTPVAPEPAPTSVPRAKGVRQLAGEALFHYRRGGVKTMSVETIGFLRRQLAQRR